jgi:hypothetical protein
VVLQQACATKPPWGTSTWWQVKCCTSTQPHAPTACWSMLLEPDIWKRFMVCRRSSFAESGAWRRTTG